MSSSSRATFDSIFMMGQSIGYAVPGYGDAIGAVLTVGQGLFDIFYPEDADAPDPVTYDELSAGLNHLQQLEWQNFEDLQLAKADGLAHDLLRELSDLRLPKQHGVSYAGAFDKAFSYEDWKAKMIAATSPVQDGDTRFATLLSWFDSVAPEHRFETLGVYVFIVDTWIHYNKLAMLWQFNIEKRAHDDEMAKWEADVKRVRKETIARNAKRKRGEPVTGPEPKVTVPTPAEFLDKSALCYASEYAENLRFDIKRHIDYVEPLYNTLADEAAAAHKALDDAFAAYDVTGAYPDKMGFYGITGFDVHISAKTQEVGDALYSMAFGVAYAEVYDSCTDNDWKTLSGKQLQALGKSLDGWKALNAKLQDPKADLASDVADGT